MSTAAPSGHVATVAAAMSQPAAVSARGEVGEQTVGVAAGDVDDPVVRRALGAHGHADRPRGGSGSTSRAWRASSSGSWASR